MKLFYYIDPDGNFGDDLNAWLWPRLILDLLDGDESTLFVGIGSILDRRIPQEPHKVVFGTGVGYGLLPVLDERWHFFCVRGPLTARALGLPAHVSVTDSAMLVSLVPTAPTNSYKVSFIPHFRTPPHSADSGIDLASICASLGINYIDPRWQVEDVLANIAGSDMLIAEAMHGAIVADALRVPWVPVQLSGRILNLKWLDWCGSLDLEYNPLTYLPVPGLDPSANMERFLRVAINATPVQSADNVLEERTGQLLARLDDLRSGGPGAGLTGSARFQPDPTVLKEVPWLYDMQIALEEVALTVPPGAIMILVDEERWGGGQALRGRHTLPFLERDGQYWGLPADSDTAVRELERLRSLGAKYVVFMQPSFWWLTHYPGLRDYLAQYRRLVSNDRVLVVALHSPTAPTPLVPPSV